MTNEFLAMRMKMFKNDSMLRLVSLTGIFLTNYLPSVLACEGCKEPSNVAGGSGVAGISASFSWSVVFMLGMLTFLLTGMLFMIIRSCKQLAAQQNAVTGTIPEPARRAPACGTRRPVFAAWQGAKMSPEIS
jgi:hypothetical protein